MSREISIYIHERWYDALSKQLKNKTLEEHLEDVLDEMCNQLPQREYERISALIWQEQQQARLNQETARRFAAFHVTEGGGSEYFVIEESMEMLQMAIRLRSYIRSPDKSMSDRFVNVFSHGRSISCEEYDAFTAERLDNTGRVTGVYDIDLDNGTFEALHIMNGWESFRIQDISAAAYYAQKKAWASLDERWKVFLKHLDSKHISRDKEPG